MRRMLLIESVKHVVIDGVRHLIWGYIPGSSKCFYAFCFVNTEDGTAEDPTEPLTCLTCAAACLLP